MSKYFGKFNIGTGMSIEITRKKHCDTDCLYKLAFKLHLVYTLSLTKLSLVSQIKILKVDCSWERVKVIVFYPFPMRTVSLTSKIV